MNIFIFHRDLRLFDNTTLIEQIKNEGSVIPIFIFTPQQIKKNKYFSHNSVQFMCESLDELSNDIKHKNGKLYFFYGDNLKVLKNIHKNIKINSIGYNIDYTPFSRKRDEEISSWANKENIKVYEKEDYLLYNLLEGQTLKQDKTPYQVFSSFRNYCMNNLKVREPDSFRNFQFKRINEKFKYSIDNIHVFYKRIQI